MSRSHLIVTMEAKEVYSRYALAKYIEVGGSFTNPAY